MRKLLVYILLFCFVGANAQVDYFTLVRDNGTRMGMVEHVAPDNPDGTRGPVILWLHGVDGNRGGPLSVNDTTRISAVTNKGPLYLVRGGTPLPMFRKPGTTGIEGLKRWNIVAPQNPSSGTSVWAPDVVDKAMEYVLSQPDKWDTSLIVMVGYSLGGRGLKVCLERPSILPYVKYAVDISGGTTSISTATSQTLAASGLPIDFYVSEDDELVDENQTDLFVNGIKAQNPVVVPNYVRFNDVIQTATTTNPEHDFMEVLIARDTTNGDTEQTTNGDTWTKTENIYQRGLRFFGPRRKHSFIGLFVFSLYPLKRRKRQKLKR